MPCNCDDIFCNVGVFVLRGLASKWNQQGILNIMNNSGQNTWYQISYSKYRWWIKSKGGGGIGTEKEAILNDWKARNTTEQTRAGRIR